ncbi:MAG: hypothetical protein Greene041662_592 [Candidatus Peregrinibacteria bacterium Greene0416_62]|nr:MAG: hypothetical protein Greene041662_592 [Candidatus Peregrinibacteria bacterium Greene0416_62]
MPEKLNREVTLLTETLNPSTLHHLIQSTEIGESTTWIAVKNLENTLRRLGHLPSNVRVLHPPFLLLDPPAVERLAAQNSLTSDEASVLTKIRWYAPRTQSDIPIHGEERAVWTGKLAATDTSDVYLEQFKNLPAVILLDQRQLLRFFDKRVQDYCTSGYKKTVKRSPNTSLALWPEFEQTTSETPRMRQPQVWTVLNEQLCNARVVCEDFRRPGFDLSEHLRMKVFDGIGHVEMFSYLRTNVPYLRTMRKGMN